MPDLPSCQLFDIGCQNSGIASNSGSAAGCQQQLQQLLAAQRVGARNQAWAPIQPRTSIAAAVPAPEVGVGHNTARRQSPSAMSTLGSTVRLVKADAAGRLRFWSVQCQENSTTVKYGLVRASEAGSTIVKMHATPAAAFEFAQLAQKRKRAAGYTRDAGRDSVTVATGAVDGMRDARGCRFDVNKSHYLTLGPCTAPSTCAGSGWLACASCSEQGRRCCVLAPRLATMKLSDCPWSRGRMYGSQSFTFCSGICARLLRLSREKMVRRPCAAAP